MKQMEVANAMGITQQSYSCMEHNHGDMMLDTIQRFCKAMEIDVPFLIDEEIPVTHETIEFFTKTSFYTLYKLNRYS